MMREELTSLLEGFKRFLGALADLILLNLWMILCCALVVPAGAAGVACYSHLLRIARGEESGLPLRPFFADFRKSFGKATAAWLLLLLGLLICAGDFYYAVYVAVPVSAFFLTLSLFLAAVLLFSALWLFPILARYENTLRAHIQNAFLLAVATLPKTLLALILHLVFLAVPFLLPDVFVYLGWVWILFGFSLPMCLTALLFRKQLGCMPEKPEQDGAGQD